jgi:hypothetical protein
VLSEHALPCPTSQTPIRSRDIIYALRRPLGALRATAAATATQRRLAKAAAAHIAVNAQSVVFEGRKTRTERTSTS